MKKNIVGNNVRTIRERLGITQEGLALKSGFNPGLYKLSGEREEGYSEKSLDMIANALGIQISGLFEEKIKRRASYRG